MQKSGTSCTPAAEKQLPEREREREGGERRSFLVLSSFAGDAAVSPSLLVFPAPAGEDVGQQRSLIFNDPVGPPRVAS